MHLNSSSLIKSFYDKSESNNFIFPVLIDGLRDFFDNRGVLTYSRQWLLRTINKSSILKNLFMNTANNGLRI